MQENRVRVCAGQKGIKMATISVCMIVKNEEKVLERCLQSLQGIWDELIIVDTGSSDKTKDIAKCYTENVYDFQWIDDFSAARNYAFSKASCEYIYSADADEVLDEMNQERFQLKEALIPEVEIVQMWYVTPPEFNTTENFDKEYRPKLYKRLREFNWIDPIHETVRLDPVVFDSDVEILHRPHDNHAGRDFRIFEKMIAEGKPLSTKLHKMYARELMLSGEKEDLASAERFFAESMGDEARGVDEWQEAVSVLCRHYRLGKKYDRFLELVLTGVANYPCSEMCYELGIYYYEKGSLQDAKEWFERAMHSTTAVIDATCQNEKPFEYLKQIEGKDV